LTSKFQKSFSIHVILYFVEFKLG